MVTLQNVSVPDFHGAVSYVVSCYLHLYLLYTTLTITNKTYNILHLTYSVFKTKDKPKTNILKIQDSDYKQVDKV